MKQYKHKSMYQSIHENSITNKKAFTVFNQNTENRPTNNNGRWQQEAKFNKQQVQQNFSASPKNKKKKQEADLYPAAEALEAWVLKTLELGNRREEWSAKRRVGLEMLELRWPSTAEEAGRSSVASILRRRKWGWEWGGFWWWIESRLCRWYEKFCGQLHLRWWWRTVTLEFALLFVFFSFLRYESFWDEVHRIPH